MPVGWFLAPFTRTTHPNGQPARVCVLDQVTDNVRNADGHWAAVEIAGDQSLCKVRAPLTVLDNLPSLLPVTPVTDPAQAWTPWKRETVNTGGTITFGKAVPTTGWKAADDDVFADQDLADLRTILAALRARADNQGVAILPAWLSWPQRNLILTLAAKAGYGLNKIRPGTFPTTSTLDDFNRTNTGPPPSSSWTTGLFGGTNGLKVINNSQMGGNAAAPTFNDGYWNAATYGPDAEVGIDIVVATGTNGDAVLDLHVQSPGGAGVDGHEMEHTQLAGTDTIKLWVFTNSVYTQLTPTINQDVNAGDSLGFEAIGSTLTAYYKTGGTWNSAGSRTDSTWSTGNVAFQCSGNSGVYDNFFGGTVVAGTTSRMLAATGVGT